MKNKKVINQLKKFNDDEPVRLTLTMAENGLTEVCYHEGEWNKKNFICDSVTIWRESELFTEVMSVGDIVQLLSNKDIKELQDIDFLGLSIIESSFGSTEIENIEWRDLLTESEEQELNEMDLYKFSEIMEFQLEFIEGSVESVKIEIGDNFSTILLR